MIRVSLTLNAGPQAGRPLAVAVVKPDAAALRQLAVGKLRLKKRDAERARLFVWGRGVEMPREGDVRAFVANGETLAVSLGEEYSGGFSRARGPDGGAPPTAGFAADELQRWSARGADLLVVEWADAQVMNRSLGRMSTLLEHPAHCALAQPRLVDVRTQRTLPSSSYVGHNLYAHVFDEFERRARDGAALAAPAGEARTAVPAPDEVDPTSGLTSDEAAFLRAWRERGGARVVINFVAGAEITLAHELCHARYALEPEYRKAADALWVEHAPHMGGWMRDLGYHASRHADEFTAYALTEATAFWRGKIDVIELRRIRALFPPAGASHCLSYS